MLPKNRKFSGAIMMTQEEEVPPEVFRFPSQTKVRGAGLGGANTLCSSFFLDSV